MYACIYHINLKQWLIYKDDKLVRVRNLWKILVLSLEINVLDLSETSQQLKNSSYSNIVELKLLIVWTLNVIFLLKNDDVVK